MADSKACGCKGIRTCLICEARETLKRSDNDQVDKHVLAVCIECGKAFEETPSQHPNHCGNGVEFSGILVFKDFVTEEEEAELKEHIYGAPFVLSQSGRQKQDFGPKVNFKKKKLKSDKFTGLPGYSRFLYDRMISLGPLADFLPVELCNLEYASDRGAAIDPHFDDFWLWGERLVTLNLLSDSVLSFSSDSQPGVEVQVPLLRRSLIIVRGDARNVWKHAIHRQHIVGTRIAMTWRELTPEFLPGGGREGEGRSLLRKALLFEGVSVGEVET